MRLTHHPILGPVARGEPVTIYVEGRPVEARAGEPLAVALLAAGIHAFGHTRKLDRPRGLYCAEGTCGECRVEVDGRPGVLACVAPVVAGMRVRLPRGELDLLGEERR